MPTGESTGTGGTRTVYVDNHVNTSGPSKTVITNRVKRGSTWYVYRTIYHHVSTQQTYGDAQQEHQSQIKHQGVNVGGNSVSTSPNSWIITRQRLLNALGYHVAVDGIWGPQSQAAWERYAGRGGNTSFNAVSQAVRKVEIRKDKIAEAKARAQQALQEAQHRLELQLHQKNAADVVQRNTEYSAVEDLRTRQANATGDYRRGVFAKNEFLPGIHADPGRLAKLALDNFKAHPGQIKNANLDLIVDMVAGNVGFDPLNAEDVKVVQRWLKSNDHDVVVDGQWGTDTNDALLDAMSQARREAQREANAAVVDAFYDSGILRVGEKAPWWYIVGGKTPEPGELVRLLNRGGFTASLLFRELMRQASTPTAQYAIWRSQHIEQLYQYATNPTGSNDFINRIMPQNEGIKIARILLDPALTPEAFHALNAQMSALVYSTNMDEFKVNLRNFEKAEQNRIETAAKNAGGGFLSFLPDQIEGSVVGVFNQLDAAAEWFQEATYSAGRILKEAFTDDTMPWEEDFWNPWSEKNSEKAKLWKADYLRWQENLPLAERIIWEIVVDPLNFVPFGKVFSLTGKGVRLTGRGAAELGATIRASEHAAMSGTTFGDSLIVVGHAIEGLPGSKLYLSPLAARMSAAAENVTSDSNAAARAYAKTVQGAKLATATKTEALIRAQGAVDLLARHSFVPAADIVAKTIGKLKISKETADNILRSTNEVGAFIPSVNNKLHLSLLDEGASFYVDKARTQLSSVGRSVRARHFEEIRKQEIHNYAYQEARDALAAETAARRSGEKLTDLEKNTILRNAYQEAKRQFGGYTRGSASPEVVALVNGRIKTLQDRWFNTTFRAWQDSLEAAAEHAGESLWDESLLWVNRNGEMALKLKGLAAKSFDEPVEIANTMYHVPTPWRTAYTLMKQEIRNRTARLHEYYEGEKLAGKRFDKDWLPKQIKEIEDDVNNAWQKVPGEKDLMWDTRETLEVSQMYLRHYGLGDVAELEDDFSDIAKVTGKGPDIVANKDIDDEISASVWMLRGARPGVHKNDGWLDSQFVNIPSKQDMKKFNTKAYSDATKRADLYLARGKDEAMGQALIKQGAFVQAMRAAQTAPFRALDYAVTGSLQAWILITLPLRPGWVVRNVIDNNTKAMLKGALDPRAYFPTGAEKIGKGIDFVGEAFMYETMHAAAFLDELFGSNVMQKYAGVLDTFWQHDRAVLDEFFKKFLIDVPEEVYTGARSIGMKLPRGKSAARTQVRRAFLQGDDDLLRLTTEAEREAVIRQAKLDVHSRDSDLAEQADEILRKAGVYDKDMIDRIGRFKQSVWAIMATGPEGFTRRALYRKVYVQEMERTGDNIAAWKKAMDEVDKTLFNYDDVTVLEENFKIFFPFIDFWRKNTTFWMKAAVRHPQIPWALHNFTETMNEANDDLPPWMRRYIKIHNPVTDLAAKIPGLGWLADAWGQDIYLDPLNTFSFAPMYRIFKEQNPLLNPEDAGWKFIAPFADAIQDFGLGFNPFFSRPMQDLGVFNYRSWQTAFPLTPVFTVLTRKFLGDRWAGKIVDLDAWIADPMFKYFGPDASERVQQDWDTYVNMEIANQVARGEAPDRKKAAEKLQDFYIVQTLVGYFSGFYTRRITPEDLFLYNMSAAMGTGLKEYDDMTPEQQYAYQLYKRRKLDPLYYDRYLETYPTMQGYYSQPSYEAAQEYLQDHIEILPYVNPAYYGRAFTTDKLKNASLQMDSSSAIQMYDLVDKLDLSPETKSLAEGMLVTDELREYWRSNDTPSEIRDAQIRGEYFRYMGQMEDAYFAIPESDFEAREGYLRENSMLTRWWESNNSNADDYKAIMNSVNADLRDHYFEMLGDGPDPDWDAATKFLQAHPFIFEFTSAASKVDPVTGEWIGSGFTQSQHALDYQRAKHALNLYFSLPVSQRAAWLAAGSPEALLVRAYFEKYSSNVAGRGGMTQHAQDYLAAKDELDYYFSLPQSKRSAWLESDDPRAKVVLDYFKKYGKTHQATRAFQANIAGLQSRNAELNKRLRFWSQYFALTPDKRPGFIYAHAEEYGIYVYGVHGDKQRADARNAYMRKAVAGGSSARAAAYMWVKPLMDYFFTLSREDRQLFVRANPELQWYFDNFGSNESPTGDPKLDKWLDQYFKYPPGSDERSHMLVDHPELQDYFDSKSSPAERAMHNLLEVYFNLPSTGNVRKDFIIEHPEIQDYFDRKADEEAFTQAQLLPFWLADPRAQKYLAVGAGVQASAQAEAAKLAARKAANLAGDDLTVRRERTPVT